MPKPAIEPVLLNKTQTARFLGMSPETFRLKLAEMYDQGFPPPEPITGLYYRGAIVAWLDRRCGIGMDITTGTPPKIDPIAERDKECWD